MKLSYDEKVCTFNGKKIRAVVTKDEIQGFVEDVQVYGIYIDRGLENARTSMATCPSGTLDNSEPIIRCMRLVLSVVNDLKYGEE